MSVVAAMHTGIQVSDMDEALHFYRDLLGLNVIFDQHSQGWLADLRRGALNSSVRVVVLRVGGHTLELLEFTPEPGAPPEATGAGVAHVAFRVDDLALTYEKLRAAGVSFLFEPREMFPGEPVTFAIGPDGVLIELIEIGTSGPGAEGIFGG